MSHIDEDQIVFDDDEQARWQDKIEARLIELTGIAPEALDVSGDDSGDPLDWTLAQIARAINYLKDEREELKVATDAAMNGLIESIRIAQDGWDDARACLREVIMEGNFNTMSKAKCARWRKAAGLANKEVSGSPAEPTG